MCGDGRLRGGVVEATTELAGLPLRYSLDDGRTWSDYRPGLRLHPAHHVTLAATYVPTHSLTHSLSLARYTATQKNEPFSFTIRHEMLLRNAELSRFLHCS